MSEGILTPVFLPLEPGNNGRVKYFANANGGQFRAFHISGSWLSPSGDIVKYINEDPIIIKGNAFIKVIANVLVRKDGEYLPTVYIHTRNCTDLVINPGDINRIAGLRPIDFNPQEEF